MKDPASERPNNRQGQGGQGGDDPERSDFDLILSEAFGVPEAAAPPTPDEPEGSVEQAPKQVPKTPHPAPFGAGFPPTASHQAKGVSKYVDPEPSFDLPPDLTPAPQRLPVVRPVEDLPAEPWDPDEAPPWYWRWSRGWRLALVGAVLLAAYAFWRGPRDYAAAKAWRGRSLAAKAVESAADGRTDEAVRLLDQAGVLGPTDPKVLRALVDFNEPRGDPMALYALRQMVKAGVAEDADVERLCRLAFDWGRPELAPTATLQAWANAPAEGLAVGKLEAGARWLASRGQVAAAEQRLRQALVLAEKSPDEPRINLALAPVLVSRATGAPTPQRVQEAGARWMAVAQSPAATPAQQVQALEALINLLLTREAQTVFSAETATEVKAELAKRLAATPDEARMGLRLSEVRLDMALHPDQRATLAAALATEASTAPAADSLRICRWLNQNGFFDEALRLIGLAAPPADDREWFICRLDALFGRRDWAELERVLGAADQPLPPLLQALFQYRAERAAGRSDEDLARRREEITTAARSADPRDVLYAAGNLEIAGETELAMPLFRLVQRDEQVGLSARLALVRCLSRFPEQTSEMRQTLEELVVLWPQSQEARNDLAYLRLLDDTPRPDDVAAVQELVKQSPQMLGFRISAGLAALQQDQPAEALRIIDGSAIPWSEVRPDWRAIYACVLAANQQQDAARALAATVPAERLRPGERALLARHLPEAP